MKTLFFISLGLYGAALLTQLAGSLLKNERVKKLAWALYLLGFGAHLGYFVWRGAVAQRLPLASQFEFACGFALCIPLVVLLLRNRMDLSWIAAAGMGATVLVQGYAAFQPMAINELMPALRSFWFVYHIGAAALSYSTFLVAACVAVRYVHQVRKGEPGDSLKMIQLEEMSFKLTALGYLLLTTVIVIGAIWAEAAWSAYWTWDPKEVWALITWIIYAVYLHLHLRSRGKDRGRFLAWYLVIAVPVVFFTFAGVNTFMHGLHTYG
jgi:cytochrome c-type biogenesis protein CcsB